MVDTTEEHQFPARVFCIIARVEHVRESLYDHRDSRVSNHLNLAKFLENLILNLDFENLLIYLIL